ncbi:Thaumatin [Parasponia andersonii]|uniref:Thaumatin n=1 Tax=Parasponia andersonii TaxID=3476 RepID=A0A2P5BXG5_PARAD|nr:Thaumatin [Parasponia andersonii]
MSSCCMVRIKFGTDSEINLKIRNSCSHTICPALIDPNSQGLSDAATEFCLTPTEAEMVAAPERKVILWAQSCLIQPDFSCVTGDCGSTGRQRQPTNATTLVEFAPVAADTQYMMTTYFVSLIEGFNLPITVVPVGGSSGEYCTSSGCTVDLNKNCPEKLRVMCGDEILGCNYNSNYSDYFQRYCPEARTSPYDDTTLACISADYFEVTFCASNFPSTAGYETQNQEFIMKNKSPKVRMILFKYLGAAVGAVSVVTLVSWKLKCAVKSVNRRNNTTTAEIQFACGMSVSNSGGDIEEAAT